jgi:CDP-diacylglycerol--glycerol-3-phosphate 3-phosphatidyltransferase
MSIPNQLTLLRILLTPVFVILLLKDSSAARYASVLVFFIASITDWYDGYTARKFDDVSKWGKFFDPLADKILISSGFVCFSIIGYIPVWMVIIMIIRDVLITLLRSYALVKGKTFQTNLFAKVKTFGQCGVLYFIFLYHLLIKEFYLQSLTRKIDTYQVIPILTGFITGITVASGIVYLVGNRSHIRQLIRDIYHIFVPSDI